VETEHGRVGEQRYCQKTILLPRIGWLVEFGMRVGGASHRTRPDLAIGMLRLDTMSLRTVEQVRRVFRIVAGFTLLAVGVVMIVTPGPGWLVILFGLSLLAAEFIWARRLMERMKREGERVRDVVSRYMPSSRGAATEVQPVQEPVVEEPAGRSAG